MVKFINAPHPVNAVSNNQSQQLASPDKYFYLINLGIFAVANTYLAYHLYRKATAEASADRVEEDAAEDGPAGHNDDGGDVESGLESVAARGPESNLHIRKFRYQFLLPYALAVAAEWLQGPHFYAMYRYEKDIPEKLVAGLYATGSISGAVSASFIGGYADKFGRKRACILYCLLNFLACSVMVSDNISVLFLGRILSGVSTTLLFSVFEAWMVTEYHDRKLQQHGLELSTMFGHMTSLSGIVAIASGVVGEILVGKLGGRIWPFLAAELCCIFGAASISGLWTENYGLKISNGFSFDGLWIGFRTIIQDRKILTLGITSCIFEGASILFIFFWSAALKSARLASGSQVELPFGVIFSSFMGALMVGSSAYMLHSTTRSTQSAMNMLSTAVLIAGFCFAGAALLHDERLAFWLFCILEGCIGAYYPSMAYLKSEAVDDSVRGRVYSIMRLPLDLLVVVAHSLDQEGDAHRNHVFFFFAALLVLTFIGLRRPLAAQQ